MPTRIAVIGAGWAGLQSSALFVNKYGCDVVIFDEKPSAGGTWAEGTAYTGLRTHGPAKTLQFIGFPYPKDLVPNDLKRISQQKVAKYVALYAQETGLTEKIRFNTKVTCIDQINNDKVEVSFKNKQTGEEKTETFDYVYNTGIGSEARKAPTFPGSDVFEGEVLTAHAVDEAALEKMKLTGETVVVLGGSKSSIDMLVMLHNAGIPTHWIARKVYYFFDYFRTWWNDHADKRPSMITRLYTNFALNVGLVSLGTSIKMLTRTGVFINPHPETANNTAFHFGSIDSDMLAIAKAAPFTQGEIGELTADGLVTKKGAVVKCKTIICAFGTDPATLFPEFRRAGEVIDVKTAPHIYQMAIHPQLPRVYFTGPHPLKGFGMLNGYHSTQHSIIMWAKNLSVAELTKRTAREEKIVRKRLANANLKFKPVLERAYTDIGNIFAYLGMTDRFFHKAGYTRPLNLSLAKVLWQILIHAKMDTVCYREPTKKEALKALRTKCIVKGDGLLVNI